MALAMVSSKPSAVESAAARPPAITRPVMTNGSPATSGIESTTKSVDRTTKSAHCTMPAPVVCTTGERPGRPAPAGANELGEHRESGEGRVGRCREVQEKDEDEGPRHRGPRLPHRGR